MGRMDGCVGVKEEGMEENAVRRLAAGLDSPAKKHGENAHLV
jgi:hypothetical protein